MPDPLKPRQRAVANLESLEGRLLAAQAVIGSMVREVQDTLALFGDASNNDHESDQENDQESDDDA